MKRIYDWVTVEMARRKNQFHPTENWQDIKIWGLFYKSNIKRHLKNGWLIPYTGSLNMGNGGYGFRCLGWYYPTKEYWESSIEPLCGGVK